MRSIKAKILVSMVLTLAISLILVGGASCILSYRGTQSTLEASMKEMAVVAADRVSYELQAYRNIVGETGSTARLSNPEITLAEKQDLLQQKVDTYGFQRYNLLNTQGRSLIDGSNYSDRAYFKAAMQGNTYVSEPLISSVTGEMTPWLLCGWQLALAAPSRPVRTASICCPKEIWRLPYPTLTATMRWANWYPPPKLLSPP